MCPALFSLCTAATQNKALKLWWEFLKSCDMVEGSLNDTHKPLDSVTVCLKESSALMTLAKCADSPDRSVNHTLGRSIRHVWCLPNTVNQSQVACWCVAFSFCHLLTPASIFASCGVDAVSSVPFLNIELRCWHISAKWEIDTLIDTCRKKSKPTDFCISLILSLPFLDRDSSFLFSRKKYLNLFKTKLHFLTSKRRR